MTLRLLLAAAASLVLSLPALAQAPTPRLVVKLRPDAAPSREAALAVARSRALPPGARYLRATAAGRHVVELPPGTDAARARALAHRLQADDPTVERAEVDLLMRTQAETVPAPTAAGGVTSDRFAHHQWPLLTREPGRVGRANFALAWQRTAGHDDVVVAVLDSGTTRHPDTAGREHAGYDMVSDLVFAADGSGRDADPTDPGNFCASGGADSDWHGDAVAGLIGAIANNGYSIAGAAHGVRLQHLRVLGRCGAWSSDVADAIVWAAGGDVPGLPRNATPSRVINLSLGAPVAGCSAFMQEAIDSAVARGAVVVASAGNDGRDGLNLPANCRGAISVAAGTESGDLAAYSNHSPAVTLTAPAGGECKRQLTSCIPFGAATVGTVGTRLFEQHAEVRYMGGTSAAAPHVAAAAALVLSANPALTPVQVTSILRASAFGAFPDDSFCAVAPGRCGAGLLDAQAAVAAAEHPLLAIAGSAAPAKVGTRVTLSATLTVGGAVAAPVALQWTQLAGPPLELDRRPDSTMAFTVPALAARADFGFEASATLADGRTVSERVLVRTTLTPTIERQRITVGLGPLSEPLGLPVLDGISVMLVDGPPGLAVAGGRLVWSDPVSGSHRVVLRTSDGVFESDDQVVVLTVQGGSATEPGGGGSSPAWLIALASALAALRRGRPLKSALAAA